MLNEHKFDKAAYDREYQRSKTETIAAQVSKDRGIKTRLQTLSISTGKSMSALIIEAVEKLLQDNNL